MQLFDSGEQDVRDRKASPQRDPSAAVSRNRTLLVRRFSELPAPSDYSRPPPDLARVEPRETD